MGSLQCHGPRAVLSSVRIRVGSKTENKSAMFFPLLFFGLLRRAHFFSPCPERISEFLHNTFFFNLSVWVHQCGGCVCACVHACVAR